MTSDLEQGSSFLSDFLKKVRQLLEEQQRYNFMDSDKYDNGRLSVSQWLGGFGDQRK